MKGCPLHLLQIGQFRIVRVGKPRRDRDGIVGMENVRSGRVVDDDRFAERSAELRQILRRRTHTISPRSKVFFRFDVDAP
jgi:hypothetical protein